MREPPKAPRKESAMTSRAHYHLLRFENAPENPERPWDEPPDPEGTDYVRAVSTHSTWEGGEAVYQAVLAAARTAGYPVDPPCQSGEAVVYLPDGAERHYNLCACEDFGDGCLAERFPRLPTPETEAPEAAPRVVLTIGRARHHAKLDGVPWMVVQQPEGAAFETLAGPDAQVGGPAPRGEGTILYVAYPPRR
jgi:hypothetical protein